jgi:cytochrome c oxidase cbb3-type subunit III
MALGERDKVSGQVTTGHEWNGIKELNTPVPRIVWAFLICTTIFAITWTILMPSWPGVNGYFRGLLGTDQHVEVMESVQEGVLERAVWSARLDAEDFATIQADPALMKIVRQTGSAMFGDNCAACHGTDAQGRPGAPNLTAAPHMWGSDPEIIAETIRVGINGTSPETRYAQMLAFGRDKMLASTEIDAVVTYVQTLSRPKLVATADTNVLTAGGELFAANCASCHGENAKGMVESGAPNLTDSFWTYGGDRASIRHSVYEGRMGTMPSWGGRLSPTDIKLLTLYVLDLRTAKP